MTRSCLAEFLDAVPPGDGVFQLAMPRGPATDYCLPLERVEADEEKVLYPLLLARGSGLAAAGDEQELIEQLRKQARPVMVDPGGDFESVTLTRPGPPRKSMPLPRTTKIAVAISHWVHVLWLNHLLPWIRLQEHWQARGWLRRTLRLRGKGPRLARRMNVIGPGCRIHPTAYVEGSILGSNVTLGPFTWVRESIIGDGVEISDHSRFTRCVVGHGCHTLNDSSFVGCTFYPDSTLASFLIRNSVIGRRVFLTSGVMFWDEPIVGTVRVTTESGEADTGRYMLGGCAGHECLLGTRAIFLPGRQVPNRTIIVMRPEEGVVKLPPHVEPNHPYVYHEGQVLPLEKVLPDYSPPELEP